MAVSLEHDLLRRDALFSEDVLQQVDELRNSSTISSRKRHDNKGT